MARTIIRNVQAIVAPPTPPSTDALDILIENCRIAAIGVGLNVDGAEVIDGAGRIVIPGLVNAHMHGWQTALRGVAHDCTIVEYMAWMYGRVTPLFTPADFGLSMLAGALNQIDCGTTTLGHWCHNSLTAAHTDAAVTALAGSGLRAVYFRGTPPMRDLSTHRAEMERLAALPAFAPDGRIMLGMAIGGPLYSPPGFAEGDLRLARSLGIACSMHHSGGPPMTELWDDLIGKGLFDRRVNIVHANTMPAGLMERLVANGVSFTITPDVEMNFGEGAPITGRLRALGAAPSLGIDIETANSGEMLIAARMALAYERLVEFQRDPMRPDHGPPENRLRGIDALAWATIEGARALGLDERIGSLVPGKQADLVMIDARALNLAPARDLVGTVLQATLANIEAVMIAGAWRKRDGRLIHPGVAEIAKRVQELGDRLIDVAGLPDRPHLAP